ncbi:alpha/beta-hydrolase family protein [Thioalkalivibrio sp. ALMg11]|uniref:alpha/beta hydrolase n=1 Tax=Thioalkalivibrio sp. ALMg11 TaxID=1158165 RepID=UPI0003769079|nr:alpha/beta-hydrolase family protein [Thioalkalivibrio sp. ALMg11]
MSVVGRLQTRLRAFIWPAWANRILGTLSIPGLILATLFFAASLTPSLIPRTDDVQGILSGVSLAAGYGVGVFFHWLWSYLELPELGERTHNTLVVIAGGGAVLIVLIFLWQATEWQNSIRALMEQEPVDGGFPIRLGLIAAAVFIATLAVARLFQLLVRFLARHLRRFIPRRLSNVIGVLVAAGVFWAVIDGVILEYSLRAADRSFQQFDVREHPGAEQPGAAFRTGSPASLISWDEGLGRQGQRFIDQAPDAAAISDFTGDGALDPIRVYVGLNAAETIEERARLALQEMLRVNAFDRSVLVLATPTGRGWVDNRAIQPVEYLHGGDVSTVAVQYSYLPSWLSLMAESQYGHETAQAVFAEIYGYWKQLPPDARPDLYLYGLSLGALNSERAADLYDVIGDPFSGALWAGPPFRSETWHDIVRQRQPDSPAWLPRFRDSSVVRFTNQGNHLDIPGAEWGPMRIVYLQYASDPVTFFEPQALYRQPEWMQAPRGPDVSPDLTWYPVITMLQLAVDVAIGDAAPRGYGHVYATEHYIDAWQAVTNVDRSADEIAWLKRHLAD